MSGPERVTGDRAEDRRRNRERVNAMRTGSYTPVDPEWREALPTRFVTDDIGSRKQRRPYTPPVDRMLRNLREQRARIVNDLEAGDDVRLLAELDNIDNEIKRLSLLPGVT